MRWGVVVLSLLATRVWRGANEAAPPPPPPSSPPSSCALLPLPLGETARWFHAPKCGTSFGATLFHYLCPDTLAPARGGGALPRRGGAPPRTVTMIGLSFLTASRCGSRRPILSTPLSDVAPRPSSEVFFVSRSRHDHARRHDLA
jgi:hypothetical protein